MECVATFPWTEWQKSVEYAEIRQFGTISLSWCLKQAINTPEVAEAIE
jgi:hypothetical protein